MNYNDFSIDSSVLSKKEIEEGRELAESYFETSSDPDQIPANKENSTWMRKEIPTCLSIIRHKKKIIGFALVIPCTKELMHQFISKEITEAQLFEKIKISQAYKTREAIYFCSVFVRPEFRGRGLALESLTFAIRNSFDLSKSPPLFYWAYSKEGDALAKRLAHDLKLPLFKRK